MKLVEVKFEVECERHRVDVEAVRSGRREHPLPVVRAKISQALFAMGFDIYEIGGALNKERTTILHYLGRTKKPAMRGVCAAGPRVK